MKHDHLIAPSEDELDTLVSIAIRRAELLDEQTPSAARAAWSEVMAFEERLAAITDAGDISGGIARVGAIQAALAAGLRKDAKQLQAKYLLDKNLSTERKAAIERAFASDQARQALRYPSLANTGTLARLVELDAWRMSIASRPHVFPIAA